MPSMTHTREQDRVAEAAADRRSLLGRIAGILFMSGAIASAPANQLLSDPEPVMRAVYATDALALVSGLIALLLPWRRLPDWAMHLIPPIATAEIVVAVWAGGAHGSVFAWYFILGAIYVGYAYQRRRDVAIHIGVVTSGMVASALLTVHADHDALVRTIVGGPTIIVGAGVIAWLREGMDKSRDELHELAESRRREARTDQLTGLGNRRKLLDDLAVALRPSSPAGTLVVFDLDGFKPYNDQFGHPAGDGLLSRVGRRLADAVEGRGEAYRLGGDEFCILLDKTPDEARPTIAAAVEALAERGESFEIGASHGLCEIPREASTPSGSLQTADKRLYADKHRRRASAGQQAGDALLTMLQTSRPELGEHVVCVADLARATARRLGLDEEEIDVTVRGAELHDIGKTAIPEEILTKPGPLSDEEWGFIHKHTLVGEHILNSAQALRPVARLVRSSHERYDGTGYPDGLAGDAIPLGSRIIAVCDAYEAMRSADRPYREPREPFAAIEELQVNSGTQFDPAVVEAFVAEVTRRLAEEPAAERPPAWEATVQPAPHPRVTRSSTPRPS
jgi:diguanylate cyclase (GGDEF)-like protein/putative nucleotidyltransferase with HDIG domain